MFKPRDVVQIVSTDHHNGKMGVVVSSEAQQVYVRLNGEIFPYYFQPAELRLMNRIETDASK
jgi:hypothetical protein